MSNATRGSKRRWSTLIGLIGALAALAACAVIIVAITFFARNDDEMSSDSPAGSDAAGAASTELSGASAAPESGSGERAIADEVPAGPEIDRDFDIALRWSRVDLDAVREAMPENLYWERAAPTTDPAIEAERAEARARRNEAYGKVLSGTASQAEIEAYYADRYRVSTDYIQFANHLLGSYGGVLPARDVGLLELSVKMHHARLQEMPRRLAEAQERKRRQDELREAWLADEAAFEQAQAEEVDRARR